MTPVLTDHARERAIEMNVLTKEVKRALREPELVYLARRDGCLVAVRGRLAIPYTTRADGTRVAITVLWHREEER